LRDRTVWEDWFNGLSGEEHAGAGFWAAERSKPIPRGCFGTAAFVQGCQEANARLANPDLLRRTEPEYRTGWNSYVRQSVPAAAAPVISADPLVALCATAKLPSSIAICSDSDLRSIAVERQRAFDEARARLSPYGQKALLADQKGWVKTYPMACGLSPAASPALPLTPAIKDCMAQAGRARVAYLRAYGANPSTVALPPSSAPPLSPPVAEKSVPPASGAPTPPPAPPATAPVEPLPTMTPKGVPFDKDAVFPDNKAPRDYLDRVDALVGLARFSGYRCDSVTTSRPMFFERGFVLYCNSGNYTYYFRDKGRGWYVSTE
jgi:hypothetical protein